ncbi:MAG: hypothetical protein A2312_00815 [Candidatus Staskawiczbacteria bacterium RIFOXYB2_FULL_32_9]|uniref:Uncharacterized protein n=1 Tax=Candidatus Staskawiczbacteria bacterium RIFOXYD1_FULL_32_13 TaxID=1802234 RepID=A0A1G2JKT2_9BACT|nr:MAG: hypothetical protein A2360_04790 [Candidatus Staskawiczbacteria bacterium RIFOXYB1_FULL_32_11]OGZ84456.1 MAG: hypothetical protein A2312_00815 [Candidatus Staskawiczbacteria bacterium RIFOXYB2_FULL_32_9]OGZ87672.1 MAG: hypothetical protein A2561_03170 [Candidatus Staskawiczbacteria bacterium RIFOXYD1_FULL_32_13]
MGDLWFGFIFLGKTTVVAERMVSVDIVERTSKSVRVANRHAPVIRGLHLLYRAVGESKFCG